MLYVLTTSYIIIRLNFAKTRKVLWKKKRKAGEGEKTPSPKKKQRENAKENVYTRIAHIHKAKKMNSRKRKIAEAKRSKNEKDRNEKFNI